MKYAGRVLVIIVLLALGILVIRAWSAHAPIPPVFAEELTLSDAAARAVQSGKPILVFATADWCGPCQDFKRTTLVDPGVTGWIRDNTVPVYLNVDQFQDEAAGLSIISIPTSIMMREGKAVSRLSGAVGVEEYSAWLKTALAQVPK